MKTETIETLRIDLRIEKSDRSGSDVPGILIADGGLGSRAGVPSPRVAAFVYGEKLPASPTLPFGRWKHAS